MLCFLLSNLCKIIYIFGKYTQECGGNFFCISQIWLKYSDCIYTVYGYIQSFEEIAAFERHFLLLPPYRGIVGRSTNYSGTPFPTLALSR